METTVLDDSTILGALPPHAVGYVDVKATNGLTDDVIPQGFLYFDPASDFGGVWGDPIDGAINVTVIDAATNGRIENAVVLAYTLDDEAITDGRTDANGQVTLSTPSMRPSTSQLQPMAMWQTQWKTFR